MAKLYVIINAFFWGLVWIPLHWFSQQSVHPVVLTFFAYFILVLLFFFFKKNYFLNFFLSKEILFLGLAYGATNLLFNWAITVGEVLRIVFLFYLMPVWSSVIAFFLIKEKVNYFSAFRLFLAISGTFLILVYENINGEIWAVDFSSGIGLADYLAILGGLCFALGNVLLRKSANLDSLTKTFSIFFGTFVVSAVFLFFNFIISSPEHSFITKFLQDWSFNDYPLEKFFFGFITFTFTLGLANFFLQLGASKLPVNVTSTLLLVEVFVAMLSTSLIDNSFLSLNEYIGGALILLSAILSFLKK